MADPTSNRYVNERPRGVLVLAYEVGLLRFHVLDGTRFESTLFPFHPLQQWEESCSRFCGSKKTFCLKNIHLCCFLLAHSINESNQWCPPFSGPHNLAICEIIHLSPAALWWNHPPNETNKNFTMLSDESSVSNILHLAKLMYFTNMDFPSNRRFPLLVTKPPSSSSSSSSSSISIHPSSILTRRWPLHESQLFSAELPDSSCHVPRHHGVPILRHVAVGPWSVRGSLQLQQQWQVWNGEHLLRPRFVFPVAVTPFFCWVFFLTWTF